MSRPSNRTTRGPHSWMRHCEGSSRSPTACTVFRMARIIVCECGTVVRGGDEQELLRGARVHMETNHPAIAEEITDRQLLALSHEDAATTVDPGSGRVAGRDAR